MSFRSLSIIFAAFCMSFSLCACSVTEVAETVVEGGNDIVQTNEGTTISDDEKKYVDESLDKPVFYNDISMNIYLTQGSEYGIDGSAWVEDGGVITYQWYSNNVNSNGGGTVIDGADSWVFGPDTSEPGTTFYYVVATNNHDDNINRATSNVATINVVQSGEWTLDETGTGYRYLAKDGSYPVNIWLRIEDQVYSIGVEGFPETGWVERAGVFYYFDESGALAPNITTPDGYQTDEFGRRITE